jgi:Rod binding domain-containing protein
MAAIAALASNSGTTALGALTSRTGTTQLPIAGKPDRIFSISGKPDIGALNSLAARGAKPDIHAKARSNAVEFESVFLNSMFSQMFTGIDGEGPFGGGGAGAGVWRSFLTEQYAKSFAKAGGVGIADHVYRSLIAHQEAAPK